MFRVCLLANLVLVSAFEPPALQNGHSLSRMFVTWKQHKPETKHFLQSVNRQRGDWLSLHGATQTGQWVNQDGSRECFGLTSPFGFSKAPLPPQHRSPPKVLKDVASFLSAIVFAIARSISLVATLLIIGCLRPDEEVLSGCASRILPDLCLVKASRADDGVHNSPTGYNEKGSSRSPTEAPEVSVSDRFSPLQSRLAPIVNAHEWRTTTATADSESTERTSKKLGDRPLWNGRWEGAKEGAEGKDEKPDELTALALEAWELVRTEYLYQGKLTSVRLPPSGPLSELARSYATGNTITWDALGTALKSHRFGSDAECHSVIRAMMRMLGDKYALFYSPQELASLVQDIDPPSAPQASAAGVGLVLRRGWISQVELDDLAGCPSPRIVTRGVFKIRRVACDSPASRAGLREGDAVLGIDGEEASAFPSLLAAQTLFKGRRGEPVSLEILRGEDDCPRTLRGGGAEETLWDCLQGRQHGGEQRQEEQVTVRRGMLNGEQAAWGMVMRGGREGGGEEGARVGYILVHDFNTRTAEEFRRIVRNFKRRSEAPNLYVIDLRNNMGGLLSAGIGLCEEILPRGCGIVELVGASGPVDSHSVLSASTALPPDVPLIVLVNGQTASSSELVAAAIKDARRGLVMGSSTFGKGTVQAIVRMKDESAVQLTIGRFKSPDDSLVPEMGILPHLHTTLPPEEEAVHAILSSHLHSPAHVKVALARATL